MKDKFLKCTWPTKMRAMEPFITSEAHSMSAMRHRMTQADKAIKKDMRFHKNRGNPQGRKHERYRGLFLPHRRNLELDEAILWMHLMDGTA